MKVVTAAEMQEIDRITILEKGMPGVVLMGLAGRAVADRAAALVPSGGRAAVFCGTGNNGGDGYVAAYFLANAGIAVDLFAVGPGDRISETARVYRDLCAKSGIGIRSVAAGADLAGVDLDEYACIIDALLGTGFSGAARGAAADVIRAINDSDSFVLSVDVPSGLGSDGRAPEGEAVIADCTVTIGLPKLSLVTYPGRSFTGELSVADIGFPASLTASGNLRTDLIDDDFFRSNGIAGIESGYAAGGDTHKGERGHLLLIGGFDGMEGAIMMAARAAFETGVGMASLLTTPAARNIIAGMIPELITISLPPDLDPSAPDPGAVRAAIAGVFDRRKYDAVLIGPGMGRGPLARTVFETLFVSAGDFGIRRMLVDGDGLYHQAVSVKTMKPDPSVNIVITPHFQEASRLCGLPVEEIRKDRHASAGRLARELACTVVLKGPSSIVTDGDRFLVNTTGNPALATAGSGDVLSGIIGALLLRRFSPLQAAGFGAWIHGRAADLCCSGQKTDLIKSTDLISYIRPSKQCPGL